MPSPRRRDGVCVVAQPQTLGGEPLPGSVDAWRLRVAGCYYDTSTRGPKRALLLLAVAALAAAALPCAVACNGTDAANVVAVHNAYRAKHGVPPLVWNATLAQNARNWSTQMAALGCYSMYHSTSYWCGRRGCATLPAHCCAVAGWR